jgi:hypothetical protein
MVVRSPIRKLCQFEAPKGNRRSLTAFGMTALWVADLCLTRHCGRVGASWEVMPI